MNITKTMFVWAVGSVGIMSSMSAYAVFGVLNNGDVLTITAGAQATSNDGDASSFATGSWWGMDLNGNGSVEMLEQVLLSPSSIPNSGIAIGQTQAVGTGTHYPGASTGTENSMMKSWQFSGNTGINYTTSGVTGGVAGLNMSGWKYAWAGVVSTTNVGSGTWPTATTAPNNCAAIGMSCSAYTSGTAKFSWDGIYGSTYSLDYLAVVPPGDPSGTGGFQYALHLTGTVQAVPEATTYGMMLAGLGLVGFVARRRSRA